MQQTLWFKQFFKEPFSKVWDRIDERDVSTLMFRHEPGFRFKSTDFKRERERENQERTKIESVVSHT
jgi:hypothetical protein